VSACSLADGGWRRGSLGRVGRGEGSVAMGGKAGEAGARRQGWGAPKGDGLVR